SRRHLFLVAGNVAQMKAGGPSPRHPILHSVHLRLRALTGDYRRVVADNPEAVAELRGDMEYGFARRDHRDIDQRAAAVDAEVEHTERNDRIVTLPLGFEISRMIIRRDQLDLRRAQPVVGTGADGNDADLDVGRGVALRHVFTEPPLLRWIVANRKCN